MGGFVRVSGYSQEDIDKAKARKIGSYTGNQSINVSSYLRTGDTANNFMIEVTGTSGQNYAAYSPAIPANARGGTSYIIPSKSLSGSTLNVTASPQAYVGMDYGGYQTLATSQFSYTYNVWYIPS